MTREEQIKDLIDFTQYMSDEFSDMVGSLIHISRFFEDFSEEFQKVLSKEIDYFWHYCTKNFQKVETIKKSHEYTVVEYQSVPMHVELFNKVEKGSPLFEQDIYDEVIQEFGSVEACKEFYNG